MAIRPRFTISTASTIWRGYAGYERLANRLGAAGIDIDATTWIGRRIPVFRRESSLESPAKIASIWFAGVDAPSLLRGQRADSQTSDASLDRRAGVTLVLRLSDGSGADADMVTIQTARDVLEASPWAKSVAIAVPAVATEGGRAHLTRMRALRRLTEEWDMDLAIDLTPRTDGKWEAEAAVQIAGPRLKIVRIRAPLLEGVGRHADVHIRTLRACVDTGFKGTVSLAPPTPFWLGWHGGSVERDLAANRDALARVYGEQRSKLVRTNSPSRH